MISEASRQHTRYIVSFPLEAHFRSLPQQYTSSSLWKIQIFTTVTGIHSSEINLQIYTWWREMRSLYHIIGCQELKPPLGEVKLSTYVLEITDLVHREKVIRGALREHTSLSFWFTDRHPRRKKMAICVASIGIRSRFITPWERDVECTLLCWVTDAASSILLRRLVHFHNCIVSSEPVFSDLYGIKSTHDVIWYARSICRF